VFKIYCICKDNEQYFHLNVLFKKQSVYFRRFIHLVDIEKVRY